MLRSQDDIVGRPILLARLTMSEYSVTPPTITSVAASAPTSRFPVRRVFCVGRNYADHAREMGANPDRDPPFFFSKPADAVVPAARGVPVPHPSPASPFFFPKPGRCLRTGGRRAAVPAPYRRLAPRD